MAESGSAAGQTPPSTGRKARRVSWIWLVPVIAALAGLFLVAQVWLNKGPTATIYFQTAEGLEAGKTQVRYKEVTIGQVERVALNTERSGVVVTIRVAKDASHLLRDGTVFWVVKPRLTVSGVSGLGTLSSGSYIGLDPIGSKGKAGVSPGRNTEFVGLELPPEVAQDRAGKRFTLRASDLGSLDVGSPIYYRRIAVGQVVGYQLAKDGQGVEVQVFIDAPNDAYVNDGTRFWNASGVDFSVDARGLQMRSQSLVSVIVGGVAFETSAQRSHTAAAANASFDLFPNEEAARAQPDGVPVPIRMRFDQSVRGLVVGAPIDAYGVTIGKVDAISLDFDSETKQFYAVVSATLYPERLGGETYQEIKQFAGKDMKHPSGRILAAMIERGTRAQLRIGNLLTGQLYVAMVEIPNAKPVTFKMEDRPFLPTAPNNLDQLQQQLNNILVKLEKVPFDEIGMELSGALKGASRLVKRMDSQLAPELQALLRQANRSLGVVGGLLAPDADLPANADTALRELGRAARSLRELSDYLQTNPDSLLRGRAPDPALRR